MSVSLFFFFFFNFDLIQQCSKSARVSFRQGLEQSAPANRYKQTLQQLQLLERTTTRRRAHKEKNETNIKEREKAKHLSRALVFSLFVLMLLMQQPSSLNI